MRSVQTQANVFLSSVKPLEGLLRYREFCVAASRQALQEGPSVPRQRSPATGGTLEPCGEIEGLAYVRCADSGSLFLAQMPEPSRWARLLAEVSRFRHAPEAFHAGLSQSRADHVYGPKLEWIEDALRLQEMKRPTVLEVVTAPSDFTQLLRESGFFAEVVTVDETSLAVGNSPPTGQPVQTAVLLESLDRSHDPEALLRAVMTRLEDGGLLFITALVASGFDLTVLGLRNGYLYPPDRANCFTLDGLSRLLQRVGLSLVEVSTPGALDVEIVQAHLRQDPLLPLSSFERQILEADEETRRAFQAFLQAQGLSSFARIVGRKESLHVSAPL